MHRRSLLAGASKSLLAGAASLAAIPARAQAGQVRLSHGYAIHYLPMMVIRDQKLLEKHAERLGLPKVETTWRILDGGNNVNDAMLAGALDIAGTGAPGFITLWAKARNNAASAVTGVCALGNGAVWLNTNRPEVKSLRDFSAQDKIAVPGIKTSFAAIVLQMAVAQEFGADNYAKLDPITVGLPHPEAFAALTSRKTEITGHVASPPFSYREITYPGVHRVLSTVDLLGPVTILVCYAPRRFAEANPKLLDAFLAAKAEADQFIVKDKAAAADIFVRISQVSGKPDDIIAMLNDPETSFTIPPAGIMKYSDFLTRSGQIKTAPAAWTELFVPQLRSMQGS